MSLRSLRASIAGQQRAKQAMKRKGWTQNYLAIEAGLSTRNSVWKFLSGRPVDRNIFMELCFQLDLDWQDVADLDVFDDETDGTETKPTITDADNLTADNLTVESLKLQLKKHFEDHDAVITSPFNFTQQFKLAEIYTIPNHLAQLSAQQWLEVSDLEQSLLSNQSIPKDTSGTISIVETIAKYSRLLILGKSGSGKTLLLKFLAQQCFADKLFADRLPLYFSLQDLLFYIQHHPDWTIKNFIGDRLASLGNPSSQKESSASFDFEEFGKILLLIDGLDEIPYGQRDSILHQMRSLLNDHPNLSVVLTSRMTAHIPFFQGVKIVELADFSWEQIQHYVQKRFSLLPDQEDPSNHPQNKSATFLELLRRPDHRLILNLAKTPILLELICCTFQERLTFPKRVTKLYQEGLEILLRRSQQTQHFQADIFYRELPLSEKFKLLGCLATNLLEQGQFYIEKADIVTIIYQYLQENFGEQLNGTDLLLKSENILSAIQLQHGLLVEQAKNIFSFSHLTFQEYLAARYLVNSLASTDQSEQLDQLMAIAERIEDPRWLEVIRLMVALLPVADQFFQHLKQVIDSTVWTDPTLLPLLTLLTEKADSIQSPYPTAAVRSYYLGLIFVRDLNLVSLITQGMVANLYPEMALDLYLVRLYEQISTLATHPQTDTLINIALAFDLENRFSLNAPLRSGLKTLRGELVAALQEPDAVTDWWQTHGAAWQAVLTNLLREERQLPLGVKLTPVLRQKLQQYYTHNLFLLQCLNGDCRVTPTVKDQLVSEILTPSTSESA